MGNSDIVKHDVTVEVTGATGTANFPVGYPINGEIRQIAIKAPSDVSSYTVALTDPDGFLLYKETGLIGDRVISMWVYVNSIITITFTSATNGTYSVRLSTKP